MQALTEILHGNNVLFSYYGYIDGNINNEVLIITKNKLQSENESLQVIKRVHNAINECVENLIKHKFYPEDETANFKSMLLVYKQGQSYIVDTVNVISKVQKDVIEERLGFLDSKTKEELKLIKSEWMSSNQLPDTEHIGLGWIGMMLRTDNFTYGFKEHKNNFLFNINFTINCQN